MRVTRFNRKRDLIIIRGFVWGPLHRQRRPLRLVLDTGAAETIIVPDVLDELGYNPREVQSRPAPTRLGSHGPTEIKRASSVQI
jgi:predicted aspartyl protease